MQFRQPKYIPFEPAAPQSPMQANRNHWSQKPTDQWKGTHMREYFYDKYLDHVGIPHITSGQKHSGMMNRVAKQLGGPIEVQNYIDAMFAMKLKNNTLETFSTTKRLGEIREYLHSTEQIGGGNPVTVGGSQPAAATTTLNALLGGE